jgi:acyl carrier protein
MNSEKVLALMVETFNIERALLNEDTSQKNLSAWDSLRHLNLIVALEDEFDVSFEPEQIAIMTSFAAIMEELNKENL